MSRAEQREVILKARDIRVAFGANEVIKGLDLSVYRGEILGFFGGCKFPDF